MERDLPNIDPQTLKGLFELISLAEQAVMIKDPVLQARYFASQSRPLLEANPMLAYLYDQAMSMSEQDLKAYVSKPASPFRRSMEEMMASGLPIDEKVQNVLETGFDQESAS